MLALGQAIDFRVYDYIRRTNIPTDYVRFVYARICPYYIQTIFFPDVTDNYCLLSRTFVATGSSILRPNTVYRVNIVLLPGSTELVIKALITKDNEHQIASGVHIADFGSSHELLLKVSYNII